MTWTTSLARIAALALCAAVFATPAFAGATPAQRNAAATVETLPFTGIPLWIAALLGAGLVAAGLTLRRHG